MPLLNNFALPTKVDLEYLSNEIGIKKRNVLPLSWQLNTGFIVISLLGKIVIESSFTSYSAPKVLTHSKVAIISSLKETLCKIFSLLDNKEAII